MKFNQQDLYKIHNDQLWTKIEDKWYLVAAFTSSHLDSTPTILQSKQIEGSTMGIKIRLSGRLKGVRMARQTVDHVGGGLRSQSIEWAIEEENRQIYTKWGTIGINVSRGGAKER